MSAVGTPSTRERLGTVKYWLSKSNTPRSARVRTPGHVRGQLWGDFAELIGVESAEEKKRCEEEVGEMMRSCAILDDGKEKGSR